MRCLLLFRHVSPPLRHHHSTFTSSVSSLPTPRSDRDRHFLSALHFFYQLEGHFSVPFDFIVPTPSNSSSTTISTTTTTIQWPKETWGMELGNRLRLFTRGRNVPYKSTMLQSIGFPYRDWRTYVWEMQILPALQIFQKEEGHLFVRQQFQVPHGETKWPRATWGLKLGSHCQLLRRDANDNLSKERKDQLNNMGFVWSDKQWKWEMQLLTALKQYRQLYGHCHVHHMFKIPLHDVLWPKRIWGYRLGHAVAKVKIKMEEQGLTGSEMEDLRQLDFFQTNLSLDVWQNVVMPTLELYPQLYDDTVIAEDFVVPDEAPWPERAWKMNLGYIVKTLNLKLIFQAEMSDDKQKLKEIGYAWESLFGKWAKEFLPALRLYKTKYGHCDIPSWWVVPTNDESWPKALRGYHLGKQVVQVRRKGRLHIDVADVLTELDALGFKFNAFESNFVDRVLPALEVYANIHGNTHVPQGFIVPSKSPWPRPSWGIKLGHTVRNIRNRHQHAQQVEMYREHLENLGFVWSIYKSTAAIKRNVVDPSVKVYKEINGESAEIPRYFVVPVDDPRYPDIAKGFELGAWVTQYNRRTIGLLPFQTKDSRKKAVSMNDKLRARPRAVNNSHAERNLTPHAEEYWKDVVLCSFQVYATQHGSCEDMADRFVVPHEEPYPKSAWGLNLGLRLRHLRHGIRYANELAKYKDELQELGVLLDKDVAMLASDSGKCANIDGENENAKAFDGEKKYSGDENIDDDGVIGAHKSHTNQCSIRTAT